ncbi:uncharacterized protein YALI1_D17725g [Yarrowia lipolytica]|uniref:Uncharacterized protein n=1 Tax=Yarrowia lipolytica TaxID=4952 RepID=A0A1D8NEM6_YARLL|nr:hypothetical protein YALI1_D17725g [Yarrowia lipolytica]
MDVLDVHLIHLRVYENSGASEGRDVKVRYVQSPPLSSFEQVAFGVKRTNNSTASDPIINRRRISRLAPSGTICIEVCSL